MGTLRDLQFALQLKIEELRQRDTLIDELELELDTKDELIRRLQEELDRYRATFSLPGTSTGSIAEEDDKLKRKTIISEPITLEPASSAATSPRSDPKTMASQRLISAAFLKSDLLKHLDDGEIGAILPFMSPAAISQGCYVFQEETVGARAYVLEEGRLEVKKDGQKLHTVVPEEVFGELALLYDCAHNYSVSAQTDSRVWAIDRRSYRATLMQNALSRLSRSLELLSSVSFLQTLPEDVVRKVLDLMEEVHFAEGELIIQQGTKGDTFYIITKGQVNVTERKDSQREEVVSTLSEGQWFGESALWGDGTRTTNVIAGEDVTCLMIDRENFKAGVGDLALDKEQESQSCTFEPDSFNLALSLSLNDFQVMRTLAVGEFGHVDLVCMSEDLKSCFAMKVRKKQLILSSGQREHVQRERDILLEAHCPFIVRLYRTFQNVECLYALTEACLGGDLLSLLKEKGAPDENGALFYSACVVEALTFLHRQCIVYRDIKPENVVLDEHGYAKLIGSGCLKKIDAGQRTWTFCGTPGYVAPEIILNQGHGVSADMWSLGVFVFELLSGHVPFCGFEPMMILTETIRGIDHLDFPKTLSKSATSLIKRLCRNNPSERLVTQRNGAKDIHEHKWFEGFDWEGLCRRTLIAPAVPKVALPVDSLSFCHYPEDSEEFYTNWDHF